MKTYTQDDIRWWTVVLPILFTAVLYYYCFAI